MTQRIRRLGVARLWYEGNAHCLLPATRASFERREWRRGDDALAAARGASTELAAVAALQDEGPGRWPGWQVVVSRCASALPAGPIDDAVFDAFLAEVLADFDAGGPWDAIYLSLHGAGITARNGAPELTLLRALRERHPRVPIGASFDLHANHAPALAALLDIACGYRTHPHVDMRETAARTLALLRRVADGEIRPVGVIRNEGLLLSSANMRTDGDGPMAALERLALAQVRPPVLDVSVYGGFPYAASAQIGASVMAWADGDRAAAERAADTVMAELRRRAREFEIPLVAPAEGIARALATPGLVAVTDPADNPMSGGIGDTPGLLRALVDARLNVPCVFASLADPGVVAAARAAGVGASMTVRLGGRLTPRYGAPVTLDVSVERLTDGRWVNTGPMERGAAVNAGATAVLRAGALRVIVCEHVVPNDDPAFYALHGVELNATRLLAAKAKNHFRAAFAPLCAAIVDIDAPGPATLDVASLARPGGEAAAG